MSVLLNRVQIEMLPEPKRGSVEKAIAPNQRGRVKALGSYWPAKFYQPDCQFHLLPEQPVIVVAIEGITLLVIPLS